jgi:hypothetical protein
VLVLAQAHGREHDDLDGRTLDHDVDDRRDHRVLGWHDTR